MPIEQRSATPDAAPSLQRVLGLWSAVSIVIGTVIGTGVFLAPSTMINQVGSVPLFFAVWVFGGLLSLFGALTYAEMAAALPEAGGEYVFLSEAYGPFWGYIYGWTQMWVAKSGSIATLATGFYYYLVNFYPSLHTALVVIPWPIGPKGGPLEITYGQLFAIALILLLAGVNYLGVKAGGNVQVVVTVIKMTLIAGIIVVGLFSAQGDFSHLASSIPVTGGVSAFFAALVGALWAYDGWNNVSMVSSEIKDPERNLPRALIFGTLAVMATYLLINVAYFYVLSPPEVAGSERLAADMMHKLHGTFAANAVTVAVLISIFAALNGSILSGSRVPYAMARDRLFFRPIAAVHPKFKTPGNSMLLLSLWSCVLVLSGRFEQLYTYVIFASWILYAMTTAAIFILRRKRPDLPRPYRVIGYPFVPALFVLAAAALLFNTLLTSPRESFMGLALISLGIPFYFYWQYQKKQ